MAKKYDLAVKTGSYQDRDGNTKNKWQNVGVVLEGKYGPYILLNRTFNPAGVPSNGEDDVVAISMFEPKGRGPQPGPVEEDDPVF